MKKIKKLFKKLNNNGSSMVMVIAALAFVGIIVGALLMAVGYSYRLKLQDLNSRDNFYYVEQAMNEIYAGVGSETVKDMQEAYSYTVENMVRYDLESKAYVTKNMDEVQESFAQRFMQYVQDNPLFNQANLADTLSSYISNDSVKLDESKVYIDKEYSTEDGRLTKITIKNITLTRTVDYEKNVAEGAYTQTISTDIEIGEPEFDVLFNATSDEYANIFKYSMVADMGVEISQPTTPITIAGNIYAATDYYNKAYNEESDGLGNYTSDYTYTITQTNEDDETETVEDPKHPNTYYTHSNITNKIYDETTNVNTYSNKYEVKYGIEQYRNVDDEISSSNEFDGVAQRSMYSGLYVENSDVTVMADMVIVPGTVAVMDEGTLTMYGKNGSLISNTELWTDNIVLGGLSDKKETGSGKTKKIEYNGASAILKTNAFVKDDTELNAAGAEFSVHGSYYGYGDSTEKDTRKFVPMVSEKYFQISYQDDAGNTVTENRGHYNSSAIIVNGQQSSIDLSNTQTIFLAGRTYIELSKDATPLESVVGEGENAKTVVSEIYTYHPTDDAFLTSAPDDTTYLRDFKTGESISVKTNQLAYIPVSAVGMPEAVMVGGVYQGYHLVEIDGMLKGSNLFENYFPSAVFDDMKIPCIMQEVSGKKYYYYDFETAYDMIKEANHTVYAMKDGQYTLVNGAKVPQSLPSAQYYAAAFISDYVEELNYEDSIISKYLTDIGDFDSLDFDAADIILPDERSTAKVYSSGAITTKQDTEFEIIQSPDWDQTKLGTLLTSVNTDASMTYNNGLSLSTQETAIAETQYESAYMLSNDLEMEYNLLKWNLDHYSASGDSNDIARNTGEIEYIKDLVSDEDFGEAAITPINKFVNMSHITVGTSISPNLTGSDSGEGILDLESGYSVWVDYNDVIVKARDEDNGCVRGIVVTKGDVSFDNNVTSFEGLIISGGKVYICGSLEAGTVANGQLKNMYSSPALCQAILRECQLMDDEDAKLVLNLFKGYEEDEDAESGDDEDEEDTDTASDTDSSDEAKRIDNIDYSDVCKFSNWMKNVE